MAERPGFNIFPRIVTVSDLVFGVALSIGSVTLIGQQATDTLHFISYILEYGLSFVILIGVWREYSHSMARITIDTLGVLYANVVLLFLVTIEPFLFNALFINIDKEMVENVSILFALDIAVMFLLLAFFCHTISNRKDVSDENEHWRFRFRMGAYLAVAAIYISSCSPVFWSWKLPVFITLFGLTIGRYVHSRVILWVIASPMVMHIFILWGEKYLQKHRSAMGKS